MMARDMKILLGGIILASVLWFWMFSPWTADLVRNFWAWMTAAGIILASYSFLLAPAWKEDIHLSLSEILLGIGLAALFWGVFWVGDKLSQLLFDFARPQVNLIYGLKDGANPLSVGLLLFFLIGPAEEIFWRGFIEKSLISRLGRWKGFIIATLLYSFVHVWSGNFMLIMAALIIGALWGFIYMMWPRHLGAVIISHSLWDLAAFILFPI